MKTMIQREWRKELAFPVARNVVDSDSKCPFSSLMVLPFEINWNVVNSVESFLKTILLLVIDYNNLVIDYQRVKNLW